MPSSRGSEMSQRQSPRTPLQLRTSSSESDGHHPPSRRASDRNPKLVDRRCTRAPITERKRGARVADKETQLRQAQEELKRIKDQLAASEAAKKEAEEKLEKYSDLALRDSNSSENKEIQGEKSGDSGLAVGEVVAAVAAEAENSAEDSSTETDVFEVPLVPLPEPKRLETPGGEMGDEGITSVNECVVAEKEQLEMPESNEVMELKAQLAGKEEEMERVVAENEELKKQAAEAAETVANVERQVEKARAKLSQAGEELEEVKGKLVKSEESIRVEIEARAGLEAEMKRLRVQTEQWRKAADAAAAVLAGDGRGVVGERCGSMDKHLFGMGYVENGVGYQPGYGSPMMDGDGLGGGGKRKGSGIRVLGDLWKKKGHK